MSMSRVSTLFFKEQHMRSLKVTKNGMKKVIGESLLSDFSLEIEILYYIIPSYGNSGGVVIFIQHLSPNWCLFDS